MSDEATKCCEARVPSPHNAQDGEAWTCNKCFRTWVHVCEESDGCWWELAPRCNVKSKGYPSWTPCRKPRGHQRKDDIHCDDLGRTWRTPSEPSQKRGRR